MEKKFAYNDHIITIFLGDSDIDYNIDDMIKIDYTNLFAEMITFPVILNRFGILLADIDNAIREKDAELEKEKADLKKERGLAEARAYQKLKAQEIKSPTIAQIEALVYQDDKHQIHENKFRESQKGKLDILHDRDIVNSIYWSCKAKNDIITKLTEKLNPIDMEQDLLDFTINNVMVKGSRKLIPTRKD